MATYIQGLTGNAPQIQQFKPDHNFYQSVLTLKQNQYDQGLQQVSSLYGSALDVELTRSDNKEKKQEFFNQIEGGIKKLAGLDLSLKQNVEQAYGLFNQFLHDESIQHDAWFTKTSKDELAKAKAFKNCINPDECGGEWWEGGERLIQLSLQEYKDASLQDALTMQPEEFVPAQNVWKIATDIMKEIDPSKTIESINNGKGYVIRNENGDIVTGEVATLLNGILGSDPRIENFFNAQAKLDRLDWVEQNKDIYGSKDVANAAYYAKAVKDTEQQLQAEVNEIKARYNIETNPESKSVLEDLYETQLEILENYRKNNKMLLGFATVIDNIEQPSSTTTAENNILGSPQKNQTDIQQKISKYMNIDEAITASIDNINYWYEMAKKNMQYTDGYSTELLDRQIANARFNMFIMQATPVFSNIWSEISIKGYGKGSGKSGNSNSSSDVAGNDDQPPYDPDQNVNEKFGGQIKKYKFGGLLRKFKIGGPDNDKLPLIGVDSEHYAFENPRYFSAFGNPKISGTLNNSFGIQMPQNYRGILIPGTKNTDAENITIDNFMSQYPMYGYGITNKMKDPNKINIGNSIVDTRKNSVYSERSKAFGYFYGITPQEWDNTKGTTPIYSTKIWNMQASPVVYNNINKNGSSRFAKTFKTVTEKKGYTNGFGKARHENPNGFVSNDFTYQSYRQIMANEANNLVNIIQTTIYGNGTSENQGLLNVINMIESNPKNNEGSSVPKSFGYDSYADFFEKTFKLTGNVNDYINQLKSDVAMDTQFDAPSIFSNFTDDNQKYLWTELVGLLYKNNQIGNLDKMLSAMSELRQNINNVNAVGKNVYDAVQGVFDEYDNMFMENYRNNIKTAIDDFASGATQSSIFGSSNNINAAFDIASRMYDLDSKNKQLNLIRNFVNYQSTPESDQSPAKVLFASCKNYENLLAGDNKDVIDNIMNWFTDENIFEPKEGNIDNLARGKKFDTKLTPVQLALLYKGNYGGGEVDEDRFYNSVSTSYANAIDKLDVDAMRIDNSGNIIIGGVYVDGLGKRDIKISAEAYNNGFNSETGEFTGITDYEIMSDSVVNEYMSTENNLPILQQSTSTINPNDKDKITDSLNKNLFSKLYQSETVVDPMTHTTLDNAYFLGTITSAYGMMYGKKERIDFEPNWETVLGSFSSILGWDADNLQVEGTEDVPYDQDEIGYIWSRVYGKAFANPSARQLVDLYNSAMESEDYGSKVYTFTINYKDPRIRNNSVKSDDKETQNEESYILSNNVNMDYLNSFLTKVLNSDFDTNTPLMAIKTSGGDSKNSDYTVFPEMTGDEASNGEKIIVNPIAINDMLSQFVYDGERQMSSSNNKIPIFDVYVTPIANNDQRYMGIHFDAKFSEGSGDNKKDYTGYTFYIPVNKFMSGDMDLFVKQYRDNSLMNYIQSTDTINISSGLCNSDITIYRSEKDNRWYFDQTSWIEDWRPQDVTSEISGSASLFRKNIYGYVNEDIVPDNLAKIQQKLFLPEYIPGGLSDDELAYQLPLLYNYIAYMRQLRIASDTEKAAARF